MQRRVLDGNNVIIGEHKSYAPLSIQVHGHNNMIVFSPQFQSQDLIITITGDNAFIFFGVNCRINGSIFCGTNSRIIIGDHFKCNHPVHFRAFEEKSITIGKHCLFANVRVETSDYHTIFDLNTRKPINSGKDIVIGDRVWCARDVIIAKGTKIGNHVVVAARAFVNKQFGDHVILAGTPASVIRENIVWTETRGAQSFPEELMPNEE